MVASEMPDTVSDWLKVLSGVILCACALILIFTIYNIYTYLY